MATIFPRKNKNGTVTWRVMFRRKGIKPFITSFSSKKKAQDFVKNYEKDYCLNPENFTIDHLKQARLREFKED